MFINFRKNHVNIFLVSFQRSLIPIPFEKMKKKTQSIAVPPKYLLYIEKKIISKVYIFHHY